MKQSINRDTRIKPDWMFDCKFIDELQDGERAFVMDSAFVEVANAWFISCDVLSSPINRGTHDTCITRNQDVIYCLSPVKRNNNLSDISVDNCFPVLLKTFTTEEKINILWEAYKQ